VTKCGDGSEVENPFCETHLIYALYLQQLVRRPAEDADSQPDTFQAIEDLERFEPYLKILESAADQVT
jgi:hypothetical protein